MTHLNLPPRLREMGLRHRVIQIVIEVLALPTARDGAAGRQFSSLCPYDDVSQSGQSRQNQSDKSGQSGQSGH